ncbi:MAG: amidohydrolase family protein [Acidimicrobiales bacterium]
MSAIPIIDTDAHLTEPPDLWTSRLPSKWIDEAPRVETDDNGLVRWRIGNRWGPRVGATSNAGRYYVPDCPETFDEIDPACYEAGSRLQWMDRYGILAQVVYSNVLAFEGHAFLALRDESLRAACVQAYNDYLVDFASQSPDRFILVANLPYWDIAATVKEIERCAAAGHRSLLWAATFEKLGLPHHTDRHWDPVYETAQATGMAINFHVGVGKSDEEMNQAHMRGGSFDVEHNTQRSALGFLSNATTIAGLIMSGLCDRFPRLNFVSVESGFGYVPYLLESLDWQWRGAGADSTHPNRLLPSEYFLRQIYCTLWFETQNLSALATYADNVMFETDFPHPTSLTPGPKSHALDPDKVALRLTEQVGTEVARKVLYENAARLYGANPR